MAKIVIAGTSDCPYYGKVEILADELVKNLPDFRLHKIVKQPTDWEEWMNSECEKRGWVHKESPMVWRELVDRGGRGVLIGGANDFQEYACNFYDIKSKYSSDDMQKVAKDNKRFKDEIDEEEREFKATIKPLHVCITSASGPVCYGMVEAFASGEMLGDNLDIAMHFYDTSEGEDRLTALEMESFDLSYPLLREITSSTDPRQAFENCSVIVLLDEIIQGEEESREDWYKRNHELFTNYAKIIEDVARQDVKVIVAGNGPINFNVYMMIKTAPNIPRKNIVALSRMTENRAKALLSHKLNVNSASVIDVIVWGNANGYNFIDLSKAGVRKFDGAIWGPPEFSRSVTDMIHDEKWLKGEFLEQLKVRRNEVETSLSHKASMELAAAVTLLLKHWWFGSPPNEIFSLGVFSEGFYGVPEEMVYSFPVVFCPKGNWTVVQDVETNDENKDKIQEAVKDLQSEINIIYPPPPPPTPPQQEFGEKVKIEGFDYDETDPTHLRESKESILADLEPSLGKIVETKEDGHKSLSEENENAEIKDEKETITE